jgi:prepilin-type processing-associated H-X9-DG protein
MAISFRIWEGDHGDKYPMALSTLSGGAQEQIYTVANSTEPTQTGYGLTNVFCVMSNELSTPKLVYCPSDGTRKATTNFMALRFNNQNMSYFICGDAQEQYPQMILVGDRNIGTVATVNTAANITNVLGQQWTGNPGTADSMYWAWSSADLHLKQGNIGLADGHADQPSVSQLQVALGNATNGASTTTPWYNFPQ